MDIEDLKKQLNDTVDRWYSQQTTDAEPKKTEAKKEIELPKDKRIVRTKTSGDRVYLLDENKKTRQWITKPEIIDSLGFTMADVAEVDDAEFLKYTMGPALYETIA